jgi:hypothetical protein
MRTRPITVFAVALALLVIAPAARAQDNWPADVQQVYNDYRMDGVIEVCDHTQATLEQTRDTIKPDFDRDYPDFREAVEAGIDKHKDGGCGGDSSSSSDDSGSGAAPPAATSTPDTGTSSGALPEASPTPDTGTESGTLPDVSPTPTVPPEDAIPPQTGATPVPTVPPAAPAATPAPAEPKIVHAGHRSLTLPIILIVIAILGALALALSALLARRNPRLRHAWREAAFRTRGTWADFSDWLRLGR